MNHISITRRVDDPVGLVRRTFSKFHPRRSFQTDGLSPPSKQRIISTDKLKRISAALMSAAVLFAGLSSNAGAALQAVGPTDPVSTVPAWYQDANGLAVQPCLDQNTMCVLTPAFDPLLTATPSPITTTGPINDLNFPNEAFYFLADGLMSVGPTLSAKARIRLALEFAFLPNVVPNAGTTFLRINMSQIASGLTPNSTYTVTHPYGSFTFTSDATGAAIPTGLTKTAVFRAQDPAAPAAGIFFPPDMQAAATTNIGPFLKGAAGLIVDPVSGHTYLGDPKVPVAVTGSPTGNNFFRITGPNIGGTGVNTIQTPLFALSGRVFTGQIPSAMSIDRATFARDATSGQIDVFATALPTASLTVSGVGIPATVMTQDVPNSGKFYAHIPLPSSALPTGVVITNSLDVPAVPHPVTLEDEVNISASFYDPAAKTLKIVANSRDNLAPVPTLSVPAFPIPNTLDATGTVVIPLTTTIPPMNVTVASSEGGQSSRSVSVFTPAPAPVAVADTATTLAGTPVTISVLANDTIAAPGIINVASVGIVSAPLSGFAVANPDGTVTYIPAAGFTGPASFSYVVANTEGTDSNAATVTVTVSAAGVAPAPVAVGDAASTTAATAVTIPVLANDTIAAPGVINTASVLIASAPLSGTAVASPTGTITYTPAAGFTGTASFTYTVANSAGTVSNAALVTVTVNPAVAAPAPVAVANTATTTAGTAVTINVLANDTIAAPGVINTGSVVIASQPLTGGTAVANLAGTVTFTPAAGFTGTTSFTYTVANTQGAVSNAATVTVTVNPAVTETVRATVVEYVVSKGSWNVQGTSSNTTTHAMTVTLTGVVAGVACNADGRVIGTTNSTGGKYILQVTGTPGGPLDPTTTNCNSVLVTSSLGGVSPNAPYALK